MLKSKAREVRLSRVNRWLVACSIRLRPTKPELFAKPSGKMLVCGALKQSRREKSVRRKNEDSRSQGDPPPVRFANHPLNDAPPFSSNRMARQFGRILAPYRSSAG